MKLKNSQNGRRKFLLQLGKSALVVSLFTYLPFKLFVPEAQKQKSISVKIHPGAVKRKGK